MAPTRPRYEDPLTPAAASKFQVRAILALVGDLHYLRPNVAAVLVHIDLDGDRPHASSLVALAAGRQVASSWGATLYAALIVHDPAAKDGATTITGLDIVERALSRAGADKIVVAMTDAPIAPLWCAIGNAWQGVIDHLRPRLVLFGADAPAGGELAPRTGARIGARLMMRARVLAGDEVELRDRDGGYVRMGDSGAAVALVGRAGAVTLSSADEDIDLVVLAHAGSADTRVELAGTTPADVSHVSGALVALGDEAAGDAALVADAQRLATLLGGHLIGGPAAAQALEPGAIVDKTTALAPELCIAIGHAKLDLAGATSLVKIGGGKAGKSADAALPGLARVGVAELVKRLEES
jgi:hypothetical protein